MCNDKYQAEFKMSIDLCQAESKMSTDEFQTFSNTRSLLSSLNISNQVSNIYWTTGKIIVLYILIFKFWIANWKSKDSAPKNSKRSLASICTYLLPE
jgi:hypothetical protein